MEKEEIVLQKYEVTTCGRIFNKITNQELSVGFDKDGYKRASLVCYNDPIRFKNGKKGRKRQPFLLHRLLALKHLEKCPYKKRIVNHKNLNKTDLRITNLEWSTVRKNTQHGFDNAAYKKIKRIKIYDITKFKEYEFVNTSMAARTLNIPISTLGDCGCRNKSYLKKYNIIVSKYY
jgi:hypothetical protein